MAKKRRQEICQHLVLEMIADAIIGCEDGDEQYASMVALVEERVACPFRAMVIGETVEVVGFEAPERGHGLDAPVRYKGNTYSIDVGSLEWIDPYARDLEWIEAFLAWRDGWD